MGRRFVAFVACLGLSACATPTPLGWEAACQTEPGLRVHEQRATDGVAAPSLYGIGGAQLILDTGAAWVELQYLGHSTPPAVASDETRRLDAAFATLFTEGPGRYRVTLDRIAEPACQAELQTAGYDPATLRFVGRASDEVRPAWFLDRACLTAERLGTTPAPYFGLDDGAWTDTDAAWLAQWSAPFVYVAMTELVDSQGSLGDAAPDILRHRRQIRARETGEVIAEDVHLLFHTGAYFDPTRRCGAPPQDGDHAFRGPVFVRGA